MKNLSTKFKTLIGRSLLTVGLERDSARSAFYKCADRGEPMHWRDIGPDEVWNAAWETATKAEREACAKVAEAAAMKMGDLGRQHRDDGNEENMDRCYARALQCTQVAADIRTRDNVENY